jgi:hypothetical protein
MDIKRLSMISGVTLLALTATTSAGPMSAANLQIVTPSAPIEQAWHYGWGRYGWYGRHGWYGRYGYWPGSTAPLVTGPAAPADGIYCGTPVRTCLLYEPGWLGTGCSCRIPGGYARGVVE